MAIVVCASFDQQAAANQAAGALSGAGFSEDRIGTFYLAAPGQHDRSSLPLGGSQPSAEVIPAERTAAGAGAGALVGLAAAAIAVPLVGPLAIAAGASVGAYAGSLYGALGALPDDTRDRQQAPATEVGPQSQARAKEGLHSGMRVVVMVDDPALAQRATTLLMAQHAIDVWTIEGSVVDGELHGDMAPH